MPACEVVACRAPRRWPTAAGPSTAPSRRHETCMQSQGDCEGMAHENPACLRSQDIAEAQLAKGFRLDSERS